MQQKNTLSFLTELGTVAQLQQASEAEAKIETLPVNSHIHLPPNFSAFETVGQAVSLAAKEGIKVLGAGNYYNFDVYAEFVQQMNANGIFPLFGTEIVALEKDLQAKGIRINDPANPGKYYICGKGITKFQNQNNQAKELLTLICENDRKRMAEMANLLSAHFANTGVAVDLDAETIIGRIVKKYNCSSNSVVLQERHLCQAFQEVFFEKVQLSQRIEKLKNILQTQPVSKPDDAVGIQNEIRSHLVKAGKCCFVSEEFVDLKTAKKLIAALGGVSCYPVLADGAKVKCQYEQTPEELVKNLKAADFLLAEFIPLRNSPEVLAEYVKAIRDAGIVVVCGTEHNTLDLVPIEPKYSDGSEIDGRIKEIFWEGTCVLAAHQFLTAHNQQGFCSSGDIPEFRKLGQAVIKAYLKRK